MSSSQHDPDRPQRIVPNVALAQSVGSSQRLRTEDSWVEITSQPSSASLSSAGDNDVVTTGLQVRRRPSGRRSHQLRIHTSSESRVLLPTGPSSATGSSQDEYEESESESDRVLSSSNEDVGKDLVEDDDDNATALGVGAAENTIFTPQPNAFSHPPMTTTNRLSSPEGPIHDSYFPITVDGAFAPVAARAHSERTVTQRRSQQQNMSLPRSFPNERRSSRDTRNNKSTTQPDHDAALRASLTTLLSCAAAVRSSPKQQEASFAPTATRQNHAEPQSFRLVSESQMLEEDSAAVSQPRSRPNSHKTTSPSARGAAPIKRKSRESSKERHVKKAKNASLKSGVTDDELLLNSTLTSWMISAGVVLVFSAISFSAGYAWGKEVGRFEGEMGVGGSSCGQEVLKAGGGGGLRRLKWTAASSSARA